MLRSQLTTSERGGEYPNWNRNCSLRCGTIVPAVACRATAATDPRNKNTAAPQSRCPSQCDDHTPDGRQAVKHIFNRLALPTRRFR
jgi:hypothetical protein